MRNAFLNFIVVELMRSIDSRATYMPTAILLLKIMSAKHLHVHFPYKLK